MRRSVYCRIISLDSCCVFSPIQDCHFRHSSILCVKNQIFLQILHKIFRHFPENTRKSNEINKSARKKERFRRTAPEKENVLQRKLCSLFRAHVSQNLSSHSTGCVALRTERIVGAGEITDSGAIVDTFQSPACNGI